MATGLKTNAIAFYCFKLQLCKERKKETKTKKQKPISLGVTGNTLLLLYI